MIFFNRIYFIYIQFKFFNRIWSYSYYVLFLNQYIRIRFIFPIRIVSSLLVTDDDDFNIFQHLISLARKKQSSIFRGFQNKNVCGFPMGTFSGIWGHFKGVKFAIYSLRKHCKIKYWFYSYLVI